MPSRGESEELQHIKFKGRLHFINGCMVVLPVNIKNKTQQTTKQTDAIRNELTNYDKMIMLIFCSQWPQLETTTTQLIIIYYLLLFNVL